MASYQHERMDAERLRQVIERIDQFNSEDPNHEVVDGVSYPRELRYSKRLTEWVLRLCPEASEELRIASRGQHIGRWTIPRDRYPMTRAGYLRWREVLKKFHAEHVAELMREAGYPEAHIQRVRAMILKRHLQTDADTQTLEDALCLLFLEAQLKDLRRKTPDEKMQEVIRKTWKKMSDRARSAALELDLGEEDRVFLTHALSLE